MLKLYENIRSHRIRVGMTQGELAKRAGYTDRSSIAKIEKGVVDLPQSKIKQFADIFGISAGELMGWDQDPEDLGALAAQVLTEPDLLELVQDYMVLDAADKATVRTLVASLAAKKKD